MRLSHLRTMAGKIGSKRLHCTLRGLHASAVRCLSAVQRLSKASHEIVFVLLG